MNAPQIKGNSDITPGNLKRKWARFTDYNSQSAAGKQDEQSGRIQKRTGEGAKRSRSDQG